MILKYWSKQTGKEKLFLIIIAGLLFFGIYTYIKYEIANHKLIKTQKEQLVVYKDSLEITKKMLLDNIASGKKANKDAKTSSHKINNKLKNDTQKINNTPVTDLELSEFLAEYEKKAASK